MLIRKRNGLGLGVLAALVFASAAATASAADSVRLKAVMIHASNDPAPPDRRIEKIEHKLRRLFRFEHYRHAGEGSLSLRLPGEGTLSLGSGYSLQVTASSAEGGRVRARVRWNRGRKALLSTSMVVGRKAPTVLGGVNHGGGKLIVTLEVR